MDTPDMWHTSSYSAASGSCVEVAEADTVLIRDTQHRHLGHLQFPTSEWTAFLQAIKDGPLADFRQK